MAVVETTVSVTTDAWTNVTPNISGTTVTLISLADKDRVLVFRAGQAGAPPDDADRAGQPLRPGQGFEKKDLLDLTFVANPDALFVRSRGAEAEVWIGFEDTN